MFRLGCWLLVLSFLSSTTLGQDSVDADYSSELPRIAPLEPSQARASMELVEGYDMDLVASEPLIADPIAFSFDAQGRLFVIEMIDYSEQADESLGRVALLVDDDCDGRMDRRSTFAEGLSWPTGVLAWKDGVIVLAPPKLMFIRDTDGDGKSDKTEVWFDGFHRNNVQGMANSLRWTVDGYVEGSTSTNGCDLVLSDGSKLSLRGRDFRLDPITRSVQVTSGGGQHGMAFNRWGDKFVTANSDHLQQVIDMDDWSSKYGTGVSLPSIRRSIALDGPQAEVFRASPVEPWRIVRTRLRVGGVVPGLVEGGGRAAGYFTGATGTWIMPADSPFGDGEHDVAFVCDVGSNLVHRKRLKRNGLYFEASRMDDQTEFLRSKDTWFRPTQLGDGPDGSLYITDMYREVIEHPLSLPPVIKKHLDLTSGRDRGRLWRVFRKSSEKNIVKLRQELRDQPLAAMNNNQLISQLIDSILWRRMMAHQLLVERHASDVVGQLDDLIKSKADAQAKILALTLLQRFGALRPETLAIAMQDQHPRLIAKCVQLAASLGDLAAVVPKVVQDGRVLHPTVELEVARSLVQLDSPLRLQAAMAVRSGSYEPLLVALTVAAMQEQSVDFLESLANDTRPTKRDDTADWFQAFLPIWHTRLVNTQTSATMREDIQRLAQGPSGVTPHASTWAQALCKVSPAVWRSIMANLSDDQRAQLLRFVRESIPVQPRPGYGSDQPKLSFRYARLLPFDELKPWAESTFVPQVDVDLQVELGEAMIESDPAQGASILIAKTEAMSPQLRERLLSTILRHRSAASELATSVASGSIPVSYLSAAVQQSLMAAVPDQESAIKSLLQKSTETDPAIVEKYRQSLANLEETEAQLTLGREVFRRECASCHRIGDLGHQVGPPLMQLNTKSPDQLLTSILEPNREVDSKYMAYVALLDDGRVLSGVIQEESASQIVLGLSGGDRVQIARTELEELKTQGKSLMPNELHLKITTEEMRQLMVFLRANQ